MINMVLQSIWATIFLFLCVFFFAYFHYWCFSFCFCCVSGDSNLVIFFCYKFYNLIQNLVSCFKRLWTNQQQLAPQRKQQEWTMKSWMTWFERMLLANCWWFWITFFESKITRFESPVNMPVTAVGSHKFII